MGRSLSGRSLREGAVLQGGSLKGRSSDRGASEGRQVEEARRRYLEEDGSEEDFPVGEEPELEVSVSQRTSEQGYLRWEGWA